MVTTESIPGAVLTNHRFEVPLNYAEPEGTKIEVFAREIAAPDGGNRPFLVFLQGGPGSEAPRPIVSMENPSWLPRALQDFRVIMLDQRGTGLSTAYGSPSEDAALDAQMLTHFRADGIVRDAEVLRELLGASQWSVLGQSFGGFTALHYLSVAPDSLREVFFTGGLPTIGRPVDDVYSRTFETMRRLNRDYHRRFPGDRDRLRRLLDSCDEGTVIAPNGEPVSRRLARTIGHQLGMDGGAEQLHYLLELDPTSNAFRHDLHSVLPFHARNPLYAVLHESSYADGGATRWSSARVEPDDFRGSSELLTGEHIYPWHFEDMAELRPYKEVADILAEHEWPTLFDRSVLSSVDVPSAAIIYTDDPFVDFRFSEETADALPTLKRWITNEHLHNGLRADGAHVLDRLIKLARGQL